MDERYIQIKSHTDENYEPVVSFGAWRVAVLNSHARFRRENMTQLERHVLTDECFVLLKGAAALHVSDGDAEHAGVIECFPLEPCKIYNVRKGVWHAVETADDTTVLVIENDDTTKENSPRLTVTPDQFPRWNPKDDRA